MGPASELVDLLALSAVFLVGSWCTGSGGRPPHQRISASVKSSLATGISSWVRDCVTVDFNAT